MLNKDGKSCRVCTKFKDWTKKEKKKQKQHQNDEKSSSSNNNLSSSSSSFISNGSLPKDCPPDSEELGRSTWTYLHTMAAYYPEVPSYAQQKSMNSFLKSFSEF